MRHRAARDGFAHGILYGIARGIMNGMAHGIMNGMTHGITAALALALALPAAAQEGDEPVETIEVTGQAIERERTAEAVEVVALDEARTRTGDLGAVLNRSRGINIRRGGGFGSAAQLSLNGLQGAQVRVFFDGVPIELSGFSVGLANIPPSLLERVEIYSGVVPIRFGADALGGVVHLVPETRYYLTSTHLSYQLGSFGTHRVIARRSQSLGDHGFVAATGFYDRSDNDFAVDVEVADARGRLADATVDRFHDGYEAFGGVVETGLLGLGPVDVLMLRGFYNQHARDIQHDFVMTVPYGEATTGGWEAGATARFEGTGWWHEQSRVEAVASYSRRVRELLDVTRYAYDWYGERIRERGTLGEIGLARGSDGVDSIIVEDNVFARLGVDLPIGEVQALRLSITPAYTTRSGENRTIEAGRDPLAAARSIVRIVSGVEYEIDLLDDTVEVIAIGKHYHYIGRNEELLPNGYFADRSRDFDRFGGGGMARWQISEWLMAKLSYEYATRLPDPDEVFGDGVLIGANLELEPEVSHNVNVSLSLALDGTPSGHWRAAVNGFVRDSDDLIVLLGGAQRVQEYRNVYRTEGRGVEVALGWRTLGDLFAFDANLTWQDMRNASTEGTFADFEGDRIPNRPWFFANLAGRLRFDGVVDREDTLSAGWDARYVEGFYRGWESVGLRAFKQTVDAQLTHTAFVAYAIPVAGIDLTGTVELDNLTDARVFDDYGVQRPGRALALRLTADF